MDKMFSIDDKEEMVSFSIRIKAADNKKLEEIANNSGRSRNFIINAAIRFALDNMGFADSQNK